eukprot:1750292-Prymnesium_polylepis.1
MSLHPFYPFHRPNGTGSENQTLQHPPKPNAKPNVLNAPAPAARTRLYSAAATDLFTPARHMPPRPADHRFHRHFLPTLVAFFGRIAVGTLLLYPYLSPLCTRGAAWREARAHPPMC